MKVIPQIILGIIFVWITLTWFMPSVFFSRKEIFNIRGNQYSVFFNEQAINRQFLNTMLLTCDKKLSLTDANGIKSTKQKFNLYICNNPSLYRFFCPFNSKGYAITNVLRNACFFSYLDTESGYASKTRNNNKIKIDVVVTHELAHILLYNSNIHLKKWIEEGYCELVGNSMITNTSSLAANYKYDYKSDKYITYMIRVEKLLKKNNIHNIEDK